MTVRLRPDSKVKYFEMGSNKQRGLFTQGGEGAPVLVRLTELSVRATLSAAAGNDVRDSKNDRENQAEPQHMRGESEAAEYEQQDDREDK